MPTVGYVSLDKVEKCIFHAASQEERTLQEISQGFYYEGAGTWAGYRAVEKYRACIESRRIAEGLITEDV